MVQAARGGSCGPMFERRRVEVRDGGGCEGERRRLESGGIGRNIEGREDGGTSKTHI